jgi:DNA-binding LacI/PurR family transcriptional regulator
MPLLRILSAAEQVAAHLRVLLLHGHWSGTLPGAYRVAEVLGVNHKTVEAALRQLEGEGLLKGQGPGRQRLIVPSSAGTRPPALRVAILPHDEVSEQNVNSILALRHALEEVGHSVVFAKKSLTELNMDIKRVARIVDQTAADVWVVCAGSPQVLEWFSARPTPAFARFGHSVGLPMAGVGFDKRTAFAAAARRLIALGHRRIVVLARKMHRLPQPGPCPQVVLDELDAHGIPTGTYNLPDWEETPAGFQQVLNALFRVTPPTALIIDEEMLFAATQQYLLRRGIRVPTDISLVCTYSDPTFAWRAPSVAHIHVDTRPVARYVARWVAAVGKGQKNFRQTTLPSEFIPGGTIGPAPNSRTRTTTPYTCGN